MVGFLELEAFLRTAEGDASYAAAVLNCSEVDVCLSIERLQKTVSVQLFSDPLRPSKNTLTDLGKRYVTYTEEALTCLQRGILETLNIQAQSEEVNTIFLNLYQTVGKSLLSDSLIGLLNGEDFSKICLEVVTSDTCQNECPLKFHSIFGHVSPNYKKFFKIRWSAVITQGLYASEDYLKDVGIPKTVDDLIGHTIIVCGSSFNNIFENENNWHLRGDYGIPKFAPSIVVSNQAALFSAINTGLGIGPAFCHRSKHLQRVLPWLSGPVSLLDFAMRADIPESFIGYLNLYDKILQDHLKAAEIEIMEREDEN